ncbi:hypothetical protein [Streptomyces sp. NPDC051577]|uniref:hypothetical protein n=1 Tax=Streptomyces sp. NPDC051577 TaxID=3155166 RepID=UPI003427179E
MTPDEELRAAAARLRTLADAATPGPWHPMRWHSEDCPATCDDPTCFMLIVTSARTGIVGDADADRDSTFHVERSVHERGQDDAAWIASMHPGVGAVLADWLDATAAYYTPGPTHPTHVVHALTVARAVLGTDGSSR